MDFRNLQGLLTISIYTILNSNDNNKKYKLEIIFKSLKNDLYNYTIFCLSGEMQNKQDESRIYLNYIINTAEKYSFITILVSYYNNNISNEEKIIDYDLFNNDLLKPFVEFIDNDLVVNCILKLKDSNNLITGIIDINQIIMTIIDILIKE